MDWTWMYLKLDYVRISYYIGEVGYTNNLVVEYLHEIIE